MNNVVFVIRTAPDIVFGWIVTKSCYPAGYLRLSGRKFFLPQNFQSFYNNSCFTKYLKYLLERFYLEYIRDSVSVAKEY